jgi:HK97 family phage major capsid protein
MTIEEIKNISAEECEARKLQIAEEMNDENANLEELTAEVEALTERKKVLIAEEEQRKALASAVATDNTVTPIEERKEETKMEQIETRNTKAYIDAFAEYIKSNDDTECRSLLTENVSGDVPVPEFVYDIVKTAWEREGIMSKVRKAYIKGNLKVGFEISSDPAVIHTEGENAVTEEDLTLGVVNLVPASIKKWISVSDEVVDLRGEDFLRYVYDELTYQIAKKSADALVEAIVNSPSTSTSSAPAVGVISITALDMSTIAKAIGTLSDEADNLTIIMNKSTWSSFKAVQYANGFNADPFEGRDVVFNNTLPAFADATSGDTVIIVGDLDHGALANFPNGEGIAFKFDDKTDMAKDLVRILGRQYVALGVVSPNAFTQIKIQ